MAKKKDCKAKPIFRSMAKQAAWDVLVKHRLELLRQIRSNRLKITELSAQQTKLKAEVAGIQQVMYEVKGGK